MITVLDADPDGGTNIRGATNVSLKPSNGAAEGVFVAGAAQVELYFNGIKRFATTSFGDAVLFSDGNLDNENRRLFFSHSDGTLRAVIGHAGASEWLLQNRIPSGDVRISAFDAGSTERTGLIFNPDTTTTIDGSNGIMILTATNKSLGFYGSTGVIKQTVTGAKGANEALTSLMPALAALGLVIDNTTF